MISKSLYLGAAFAIVLAACSGSQQPTSPAYRSSGSEYEITVESTVSFVPSGKPNCFKKVVTWFAHSSMDGQSYYLGGDGKEILPSSPPSFTGSSFNEAVAKWAAYAKVDQ